MKGGRMRWTRTTPKQESRDPASLSTVEQTPLKSPTMTVLVCYAIESLDMPQCPSDGLIKVTGAHENSGKSKPKRTGHDDILSILSLPKTFPGLMAGLERGFYLQSTYFVAWGFDSGQSYARSTEEEGKKLQDRLQIYEDIRCAPEIYCTNQSEISEGPTPHDSVLDHGRRDLSAD